MSTTDQTAQQELELVFPANLVAEALRSGPYKTSANAIAEIVDNSYDAGAQEIHVALICDASSKQLRTIAVLDDGYGMDEVMLRCCLQYGKHQHRRNVHKRIGKFGVGLLSASFNQCKDLELYSWDNGLREDAVNSTHISVDKCPATLPPVIAKPLPDFFEKSFAIFDREASELETHGTLVVWRELDRLSWKRAETHSKHLQEEIGRIYREFLSKGKLKVVISMVEQSNDAFKVVEQIEVKPVDPLFLSHWDCKELNLYLSDLEDVKKKPEDYRVTKSEVEAALSKKHLFIPFDFINENDNAYSEDGQIKKTEYTVKDDNGNVLGSYRITASYRWPKVVRAAAWAGINDSRNPGNAMYGKLAEKLRGVSIMRGGRELTLDPNWLRADQTIDRWVALSLDFDPTLDGVFGVSNDKQNAAHLSALAQIKTSVADPSNHNKHAFEAASHIHRILGRMRRLVNRNDPKPPIVEPDLQGSTDPAHEKATEIKIISEKFADRVKRNPGSEISGIDDQDLLIEKLAESYRDATIDSRKAELERPSFLIDNNLRVDMVTDPVASSSDMFSAINNASGAMVIRLNANHPLYETLHQLLNIESEETTEQDEKPDNLDVDELKDKLNKSFTVIRRMIIAYARAELEAPPGQKEQFERVRREWSFVTKDLFEEDE